MLWRRGVGRIGRGGPSHRGRGRRGGRKGLGDGVGRKIGRLGGLDS